MCMNQLVEYKTYFVYIILSLSFLLLFFLFSLGNLVFPLEIKLLNVVRILQIEYRLMSSIIFHYFYKNNKSLWYTLLLSEIHLTVEIWSFAVIKAYITNITRVYSKQVPGRPIGNHIHVHIYQKFKVRRKV